MNLKKTILEKPFTIGDIVYVVLHDTSPYVSKTIDAYEITKTKVTDISENHTSGHPDREYLSLIPVPGPVRPATVRKLSGISSTVRNQFRGQSLI